MSIGTLVCFLFAKNVVKHIKTDSKTGEWDIELKASLDDSIEVDVRTDGGEATTEISVLTAMYVIVSHTFDVTGISQLDCFAEDYSTYVSKELAHMPREELIEKLREMGAMSEVEFLTKGSTSEETCTSTDTSMGVDVDFETVMRIDGMPSGETEVIALVRP